MVQEVRLRNLAKSSEQIIIYACQAQIERSNPVEYINKPLNADYHGRQKSIKKRGS